MHSLGIVQWNSTRRGHPGNPGGVSRSGLVIVVLNGRKNYIEKMLGFREDAVHFF